MLGVSDAMNIKPNIILEIIGKICEHNKQNYGNYEKE